MFLLVQTVQIVIDSKCQSKRIVSKYGEWSSLFTVYFLLFDETWSWLVDCFLCASSRLSLCCRVGPRLSLSTYTDHEHSYWRFILGIRLTPARFVSGHHHVFGVKPASSCRGVITTKRQTNKQGAVASFTSAWIVRYQLSTMKFCKNLQRIVEISDPAYSPFFVNYRMLSKSTISFLSWSSFLESDFFGSTADDVALVLIYLWISDRNISPCLWNSEDTSRPLRMWYRSSTMNRFDSTLSCHGTSQRHFFRHLIKQRSSLKTCHR